MPDIGVRKKNSADSDLIDVGGTRVATRRFGRGEPLLLLNRFRGTMDDWDPALVDVLAHDRRVTLFDSRGVGETEGEVPATVEPAADFVAEVIRALGVEATDVLGWRFAGYAMWTLNTPFLFAMEGVETEEIQPWQENGETWRRLKVTFPRTIATHSAVQTFYIDDESLRKRHDYDVEVSGGSPAAQYAYDYKEFSGILVPTKRRVFARRDGGFVPEPLIVSIDLSEIEFR